MEWPWKRKSPEKPNDEQHIELLGSGDSYIVTLNQIDKLFPTLGTELSKLGFTINISETKIESYFTRVVCQIRPKESNYPEISITGEVVKQPEGDNGPIVNFEDNFFVQFLHGARDEHNKLHKGKTYGNTPEEIAQAIQDIDLDLEIDKVKSTE